MGNGAFSEHLVLSTGLNMTTPHRHVWFKSIQHSIQHWTARYWLETQPDERGPYIKCNPVNSPQECELTILNEQGIHARPAAAFVRCARGYESDIDILKCGTTYSAKSILAVLTANLNFGATFTLRADGPDATQALEGIRKLLGQLQREDPPLSAEKTASQKTG